MVGRLGCFRPDPLPSVLPDVPSNRVYAIIEFGQMETNDRECVFPSVGVVSVGHIFLSFSTAPFA